ncbi:MAG: DUF4040 domain-containing protein [Labilithrix sp.]|nr:DUF4040 domain-containing protein [Labilithrix sp.]
MSLVDWTLDGVLAALLPLIAWGVVTAASLDKAIMLFIVLGFVSALAWARLDAIDVALVEAAVGSGLTGALLLSALPAIQPRLRRPSSLARRAGVGALLAGITIWLGVTTLRLPARSGGLAALVCENIEQSGALHPITAVLLDFRGYDTLIEVAVLLVASLAVRAVQRPRLRPGRRGEPTSEPLASFLNLLVPASIVIAGFLVWEGSHAPGGAFQAGSILAGCGVSLQLTGERPALRMTLRVRAALVLGLAVFVALAGAPLLRGHDLLDYPRPWAGPLVFALELALTVSIAVILVTFFPGAPDRPEPPARAADSP